MAINPLLPSISNNSAPTKVQGTDIFHTQDRNLTDKIRFVFEAPAPRQTDNPYRLTPVNDSGAEAFRVLLEEQQQQPATIESGAKASPYADAVEAYSKAEDVARYARNNNLDLGFL